MLDAGLKVRIDLAKKILDGADERQFQRYRSTIRELPGVADVMERGAKHDAAVEARERDWIARHPQ